MTDTSPLTTVDIEDIFASDPRVLTPDDHKRLVLELRRRRSIFASEEAAKQAQGKRGKPKAEPKPAATAAALDKPNSELNYDDLFS